MSWLKDRLTVNNPSIHCHLNFYLFIPQLHSDLMTNAVCGGITQLPILPIQDIRAVVEVC